MSAADDVLIRHKLDVDDYHRMGAAGILHEDDRIELIEGELIEMAPIGQDHAATVNELTEGLVLASVGRAIVSVQNPVRLDQFSEPQPDFAILRDKPHRYRGVPPMPADVLALIEVADSSLRYDRTVKLALYARAGIPEVWIVDLKRRVVDVHRMPGADGYADMTTYQPGDTIAPALDPEIRVALAGVFG